jgi:hypothetical protein
MRISRQRAAAGLGVALAAALGWPASAAARPLLLPSPVTALDTKVPLRTNAPRTQLQLPVNARLDSRERVLVRTLPDGRVVGVRVVQRMTLRGTGDYFLSVPAPLLDVRAAPGSQAEPGFRRSGILWQGFSNRRRVLAADAKVDPGRAAAALPLRVELTATVGGNELGRGERRTGRLRLELRLRNTTAVQVQAASARAARPREVRRLTARIASEIRKGEIPEQPAPEVVGRITTRTVVVDAPLVVSGELRLPARRLDAAAVRGGSLVRRGRDVGVRFRLVLAAPKSTATVVLTGSVVDAAPPRSTVVAEPSQELALAGVDQAATIDATSLVLLRLARVRQYDAFLANPAPGGSVEAVYRYETAVAASAPAEAATSDEGGGVILPLLVVVGLLAGAGGLVVLWAHL